MSFQKQKLLTDSNSYFRLAKSLHPLLNNSFGENNYCVYILRDCDQEYSRSQTLQNKFSWFNEIGYVQNRINGLLNYSEHEDAIVNNSRFIKVYAQENYLDISRVDIKYLATSLELNIILITDDEAMIVIAKEFEIKVMKTLELLKLMLDCGFIGIEKVKEITSYWLYMKDTPKYFKEDCYKLFGLKY